MVDCSLLIRLNVCDAYYFCYLYVFIAKSFYYCEIFTMFRKVILEVRNQIYRLNTVRFFSQETNEATKIEKTVNNVTLLGRVGTDPQKRGSTQHPVIIFSLATHTNYKYETGDFMQRTDWHKVCVFKPTLRDTVYMYLKKGQRVLVNGRISYSEFKDEEGNSHPSTAIIADDVIFFQ